MAPQRLLGRYHGVAFILNPGVKKIQNWNREVHMTQTKGPWDSQVKGEMSGLSWGHRGGTVGSLLSYYRGTSSLGNMGWLHLFLIQHWLSWRLSQGFSLLGDCGVLGMKRASVLASDHPCLRDFPVALILWVNLLFLVSIQTKIVSPTLLNMLVYYFLLPLTQYHRKNF